MCIIAYYAETTRSSSRNILETIQQSKTRGRNVVSSISSAPIAKDAAKEGSNSDSRISEKMNSGKSLTSVIHPCKQIKLPPPPPPSTKRIGPRPCRVCYLSEEQAAASMPTFASVSPVLQNLSFVHEENPTKTETHGGSDFGGYPSLKERIDAFDIKESMTVHCGFVKGSRPGRGSGFDIDEDDLSELDKHHGVIVASAIFGNYDVIQEPVNISQTAQRHVPFYMFIDEETENYMRNKSVLNSNKMVGLWRIIVVRNIPYSDSRRNGKVPKLLLHRLFPNVRYSIWIDGKLKLIRDPYQVLERFLWRENATFAISRHYTRFDVFVEAEANKVGGKYDNASIDYQIGFYQNEGLTPYSKAKLPITSGVYVNLASSLSRLLNPVIYFCPTFIYSSYWFLTITSFFPLINYSEKSSKDIMRFMCVLVTVAYHRELLENMPPPRPPRMLVRRQPPVRTTPPIRKEVGRKVPSKRGRDRRSGSRHHRKVVASSRDSNFL
ncbi:Protein FAM83H [Bienertia sinuspersici]